jgi:hypothetical protein
LADSITDFRKAVSYGNAWQVQVAAENMKSAALRLDTYWNLDFVSGFIRSVSKGSDKDSLDVLMKRLDQIRNTKDTREFFQTYIAFLLQNVGQNALMQAGRDFLRSPDPLNKGHLRNPLDPSDQGYGAVKQRALWPKGLIRNYTAKTLNQFMWKSQTDRLPESEGATAYEAYLNGLDAQFDGEMTASMRTRRGRYTFNTNNFSENPTIMLYQVAALIRSTGRPELAPLANELHRRALRIITLMGLDPNE